MDDRLLEIIIFGHRSEAKRKAVYPRFDWEEVIRQDLNEIWNCWEEVKCEASNRLGLGMRLPSCVDLGQFGAVSCI